jgi:8-oxo-dGTP diphosphatase
VFSTRAVSQFELENFQPRGHVLRVTRASNDSPRPTTLVAAAVIVRGDRVLLTQRPRGTHLEDHWEFPGGKVEPDEDPRAALARELREELGVDSTVKDVLECTFWRYPNKSVLLLFFLTEISPDAEIQHLEVSDHRWATEGELAGFTMPPADVPIVARVRQLLLAAASSSV